MRRRDLKLSSGVKARACSALRRDRSPDLLKNGFVRWLVEAFQNLPRIQNLSRTFLEVEAEGELEVALAAGYAAARGQDLAEGGQVRWIEPDVGAAAATAASAPVRVVDEVKGFGAELEADVFFDGEGLEEAKVPVLVAGLIDDVTNLLGAESTGSRLGENR